MDENKFRRHFWMKVVIVGLLAGLIGGSISMLAVNVWTRHEQNTVTRVPSGSTKPGGASIQGNKAQLKNPSTQAYNSVKDSVVSVINKQHVQNSGNSVFDMFGGDSSSNSNSGKLQTASEGSGVIYKKHNGIAYVVTNNHVVSGSNALEVILSNGKKVSAGLVGTDSTTDLAVLKISAKNVNTVARFGNSNDIAAGQDVLAIGSPMGSEYANTVTKGIISAKKRTLRVSTSDDDSSSSDSGNSTTTNVIQTDAAINSGNSGGPLINMAGQVIGINSMKLSSNGEGSSVEGMGFSIPSNEVVRIINQLVAHGKVERPTLGVSMINLSNVTSDSQKTVLKLPSSVNTGVVLMKVQSGSDAANAGLKKYDVITKLGNSRVQGSGDLKTALYKHKVGDTVKITYYRSGNQHVATVKLSQTASAKVENDN